MKTAASLWMLRTAFRTVGSVAPGVAARWAETIFCRPPRNELRPLEEAFLATGTRLTVRSEDQDGHRAILRHPEVIRRTVAFLQGDIGG